MYDGALHIKWYEEDDEVAIICGVDGNPRLSECVIKGYPYKIWSYGYMEGKVFKAVVKPLNTLATHYMSIEFKADAVKIGFKSRPCFTEFILKSAMEPEFIRKNKLLKSVTQGTVGLVVGTAEKPVKFRAEK